jgi:hypothetical protein
MLVERSREPQLWASLGEGDALDSPYRRHCVCVSLPRPAHSLLVGTDLGIQNQSQMEQEPAWATQRIHHRLGNDTVREYRA